MISIQAEKSHDFSLFSFLPSPSTLDGSLMFYFHANKKENINDENFNEFLMRLLLSFFSFFLTQQLFLCFRINFTQQHIHQPTVAGPHDIITHIGIVVYVFMCFAFIHSTKQRVDGGEEKHDDEESRKCLKTVVW